MRLSEKAFAELVRQALELLPRHFRDYLENVSIDVQPRPTARQLEELGGGDRHELLGAYFGVPMTERHIEDAVEWPEQIVIFQRNVEDTCRSREEVVEEVRKTVLHEIAHHFGMDEDELEELGYQ